MLTEIIKDEQQKRQVWYNNLVKEHTEQYHRMVLLKGKLEKLADGLLQLDIAFSEPTEENITKGYSPTLRVVNIKGCVNIRGDIDELKVSGVGLFNLMGEKHSVENFFRKIALYLK